MTPNPAQIMFTYLQSEVRTRDRESEPQPGHTSFIEIGRGIINYFYVMHFHLGFTHLMQIDTSILNTDISIYY